MLDDKTLSKISHMVHAMGGLEPRILINNFKGDQIMTNDHTNNSTTITGGTVSGNQFAAGSTEFKGTINNISSIKQDEIKQLSLSLIEALRAEADQITEANVAEITDAINQVSEAASAETVNKLSLNGLLTGIKMVMNDVKGISVATKQVYLDWHQEISTLFS